MMHFAFRFFQEGMDAPVVKVYRNDTGASVVFTRDSAGLYVATFSAYVFNVFYPLVLPQQRFRTQLDGIWRTISVEPYGANQLQIKTLEEDGSGPVECNGSFDCSIQLFYHPAE